MCVLFWLTDEQWAVIEPLTAADRVCLDEALVAPGRSAG
jgi:hypothetical protein